MIGTYDFCGHYEWTFSWLERRGGRALLMEYMEEAISRDSQRHARELIMEKGFEGMMEYWGHTLAEESPDRGFHMTASADAVRCDMYDCPSKGFLLRNNLEQHPDYCDHCIQWIKPLMDDAGFVVHHEHNHHGQCWWEFSKKDAPRAPSEPGEMAGEHDARFRPGWRRPNHDTFGPDEPRHPESPGTPT